MLKKYLIEIIKGPVRSKKRRYISRELGVKGFFYELNRRSVDYCVLRWFETLPDIKEGEDIDILVSDDYIDSISDLFKGSFRNGIPCDLYSASGVPGSDFRGVAYYPPNLANDVLNNVVLYKDMFKVPCPRTHFLSLAYHCLFHKGYNSGLAVNSKDDNLQGGNVEHEYKNILKKLSKDIYENIEDFTLEGLLSYLKKMDWVPPLDTLEKLAYKNQWIKDRFFSDIGCEKYPKGISTFVVREKGRGLLPEIKNIIEREGFEIIVENEIQGALREQFSMEVRGGNWHRGPWAISGGKPSYIIIAIDVFPIAPPVESIVKNFTLDNYRVVLVKEKIRNFYNSLVADELTTNIVHSSDNSAQAMHYAKVAGFDADSISRKAVKLLSLVTLPWVEKNILSGHSRRALVRLVEIDGKEYVCKTFRSGCKRYLDAEVSACKHLLSCDGVLDYYRQIGLHILYPFIETHSKPIFSNKDLYRIRGFVECASKKGRQLIDFKPSNILKSANGELFFVDFEFSFVEPESFDLNRAFCFGFYPDDIDLPSGSLAGVNNYNKKWLATIMLPRILFLRISNFYFFVLARLFFSPFYLLYFCVLLPVILRIKKLFNYVLKTYSRVKRFLCA